MKINDGGIGPDKASYRTINQAKNTESKPENTSIVKADRFNPAGKLSLDTFRDALSVIPRPGPGEITGKVIEENTVQYADSYGRVKHLALQLSDYVSGETRSQVLNAYKALFTNMEPDTKFTVVVESDRDREDVEKVIRDNNVVNPERFKFIKPDEGGLTVWARDMMIGMYLPESESQNALLNQSMLHNWHASDAKVPAYIASENPNITLDREPRLVTDGGDTVSNRNESYVGFYSIAATAINLENMADESPVLRGQMMAYYENNFGKEVVKSKSDNPLSFNIVPMDYPKEIHRIPFKVEPNPDYKPAKLKEGQVDEGQMYEDLAVELFKQQFGKKINVMGKDDPATEEYEMPASDHMDMGLTPVDEKTFMLGDPGLTDSIFRSMSSDELKQAEAVLSKAAGKKIDLKKHLADTRDDDSPHDFNMYEKKLTQDGYRVVRLPHSEPDWWGPYITYNNCLMERFDKNGDGTEYRRVFLPVMGIEKLDDYAVNAYKNEGFEVIPMRMDSLSSRWGALRCISNWLERSPRG
ncbi:MAG: hypothetical protein K8T10_13700 [Candidatus Eremiobacteraeota bacterium]|nr:hypothetical protein [Candidatus Eremiobacteraeota bacterium]